MLRNIIVAAALVGLSVPSLARAEFVARKSVEIRPTATVKVAVAKAETTVIETKVAEEPLTIDGMLGKINSAYMMGMQRCYMKGLRQDPTLGGKVTVVLTVNPDGRVSGSATGIAPAVDTCLTSKLATWRFASPRDHKDKPTQQSFKISLLLRQ
jgi:hypothetical protein